ncbi:RNA polymerase III subunit RPC82 [Xylariaceae sp. FL0016]|nr:RNA polymerase III subunit RPC82 [Xylariaceae sp. FL0016]
MLVTRNAAELCVLLINELYGQLPSRIFASLVARGRSNVHQLAHHTGLQLKPIRSGLAVLIQQDLIFHHTDPDQNDAFYEADSKAAYNLIRVGKIIDMIHSQYGPVARHIVNDILTTGHVEIGELIRYYKETHGGMKRLTNGLTNGNGHHGHANGDTNGESIFVDGDDEASSATEEEGSAQEGEIRDMVAHLIASGFLETVAPDMFQSPEDLQTAVEQEAHKQFPQGVRGSKQTSELDSAISAHFKAIRDERSILKRTLQDVAMYAPKNKRRKLDNGATASNFVGVGLGSRLEDELHIVVRLNYEKCLVELRNQRLVAYAEDLIGETTAQVYSALLTGLSKKINRCRHDSSGTAEAVDTDSLAGIRITTLEVFEHLGVSVDVSSGIGAASEDDIDIRYAERIHYNPPQTDGLGDEDGLKDEDHIMDSDDENFDTSGEALRSACLNGNRSSHVNIEGGLSRIQRIEQMRQHLLLLAESKQHFVRHCGSNDHGEWTVDFGPLIQHLRFSELDTIIEESFGRQGLRLTRLLREKGKIEDKSLPAMALMTKQDVHMKMAEMEMAGFLDVQEVPRDNNRAANRTIFLWFFDEERTLKRTLEQTYKSMVRCFQRLEVERRKKRNVLSVAERKDVQGQEEEKLRGDVYNEYLEFLRIEKRLLGQIGRLDDLVAVVRDF